MKKVDCNSQICVLGAQFENVYEIIRCAYDKEPKDGVYVGEDSERYPCFDYEDYASETRRYWNFVFATSENEMLEKLSKLKAMDTLDSDYYKFTEELAPMAYWGGNTNRQVFLTDNLGV